MRPYKIIGIAVSALAAGIVVTLVVLNPTNSAEMSENAADNLKTRRYDVPNEIFAPNDSIRKPGVIMEIERILSQQKTYGRSWRVLDTKIEADSVVVKTEVPVLIFIDDLEVKIRFAPSGNFDSTRQKAIINVRSASRTGRSDLGENRRHIEQLLEELDFAFGNDRINL